VNEHLNLSTSSGQLCLSEAESCLNRIAQLFNSPVSDNKIILNDNSFSGSIRLLAAAEVFAWVWDFHTVAEIKNLPLCSESPGRIMLAYCLTPENIVLEEHKETEQLYLSHAQYISTNITRGNVKLLVLEVSAEWLSSTYNEDDSIAGLIGNIIDRPNSIQLQQQFSPPLIMSLSFMYDHLSKHHDDIIYIKTRFSSFFYDALQINANNHEKLIKGPDKQMVDLMNDTEKILLQHLHKELPRLDSISKQVGVSSSTLKRNFSKVFGMPVYDYYLRRKLAIAWQYLFEQEMPVKETAYLLGYENVSSFITIFKKHFHCLPGDVKKSKKRSYLKKSITLY